jgi:hypothetical protein
MEITPEYERALNLIFRLSDVDKDFHLSDHELNEFHSRVYSTELTTSDIDGIKDVINAHCGGGVNEHGLTLDGFKIM